MVSNIHTENISSISLVVIIPKDLNGHLLLVTAQAYCPNSVTRPLTYS